MRKMNLRRRVAKKQRGSGFSFGVDQPQIAGQPEVVRYSDCGSVNTPTPMNQSSANVVGENAPQGCAAPASNTTIPAGNTVNAALNAPANVEAQYTNDLTQAGGRRRRRRRRSRKNKSSSKKNKNSASRKNRKSSSKRKNRRSSSKKSSSRSSKKSSSRRASSRRK